MWHDLGRAEAGSELIPTPAKCAQCSLRIEAGDLVVFMHGDLFHRACWRILASNIRIEESAKLKKQSRDLIAEARATVPRQKPKE